jgi:hypothetical protein
MNKFVVKFHGFGWQFRSCCFHGFTLDGILSSPGISPAAKHMVFATQDNYYSENYRYRHQHRHGHAAIFLKPKTSCLRSPQNSDTLEA